MTNSYWQDRVVMVTGASSGLGAELATAFAERGAQLILTARRSEALEKLSLDLERFGKKPWVCLADLTKPEEVERLFHSAEERFGRLDALVNNAGRSVRGEIAATTPEDFRDLMEINFLAAVRCTQAALPQLLKHRGHVVNIGSLASKAVSRFVGAYPATKHALAAYSQQLRLELGPQGLHVLLVCPGPINLKDRREFSQEDLNGLPDSARKPGAGVKLKSLDPERLARRIVDACEKRTGELIFPRSARLLFILMQISPRLSDFLLRYFSG